MLCQPLLILQPPEALENIAPRFLLQRLVVGSQGRGPFGITGVGRPQRGSGTLKVSSILRDTNLS